MQTCSCAGHHQQLACMSTTFIAAAEAAAHLLSSLAAALTVVGSPDLSSVVCRISESKQGILYSFSMPARTACTLQKVLKAGSTPVRSELEAHHALHTPCQ